jgi:hypothetical protein
VAIAADLSVTFARSRTRPREVTRRSCR